MRAGKDHLVHHWPYDYIQGGPKVRKNGICFRLYILDGRLGLIFLPQILGGRSQILGRLRRLKRRD